MSQVAEQGGAIEGDLPRRSVLFRRGDNALYRERHGSDRGADLLVVPEAETGARDKRLEHEFTLAAELDPAWAARPLRLSREAAGTVLWLEDPGGAPADGLIGQQLDTPGFLNVAIAAAEAVGRLHTQGLIHRDIKPANILVDREGRKAWLTGFGVASRLQRIDRDVQHAGGVIQSLRALMTKSGPNRAWVEVGTLVDEVLVLVGNQLRNRNVRVVTALCCEVPPIFADRVQLQQVILNLVVNGAEAMAAAEALRVVTIASSAAQDGGVHVSVADTGPGMDPATAERVFDSFFTTKSSGMGMGLSICRSIISAHGGRIWVEPNTPHGAIFQFTVPPGNEAAEPAGESRA